VSNGYILDHVVNNTIRFPRSSVIGGGSIAEYLEESFVNSDVLLAITRALSVLKGSHVSKGRKSGGKCNSRVSRDAMLLAEIGLFHTVDLGNEDFALLKRSRGLFIVGS